MEALGNLQDILAALSQEDEGVLGAVLATPDGLVLAASGQLTGDLPAASAAGLVQQVNEALAAMSSGKVHQMLLWSAADIWSVNLLLGGHLLMLRCAPTLPAGAVRLLGQLAQEQLNAGLAQAVLP